MSKYNYEVDLSVDNSASQIINLISNASRVLEFGCASGYMTKILKEVKSCVIDCVEINEQDAEIAKAYCDKMLVGDLELIDFNILDGWGKYDYIIFADVLEHLKNPEKVLEKCKMLLKENGEILSSIPNVAHASIVFNLLDGKFQYQRIGLLDNTHLKLFTKKTILELFEESGYMARVVGKTVINPQFSEFATDISRYPREIVDYIYDNNSEANTYQFIVSSKICSEENLLKELVTEKGRMEEEILKLRKTMNHQQETLTMQINYSKKIEAIVQTKDDDYKKLEENYVALREEILNLNVKLAEMDGKSKSSIDKLALYEMEAIQRENEIAEKKLIIDKGQADIEELKYSYEILKNELENVKARKWYEILMGKK
jgi:O-antigen biosynthesis protein